MKQMLLATFVFSVLLCSVLVSGSCAQETKGGPELLVGSDVHRLDAISQQVASYLNAMSTFQVESRTNWMLDGDDRKVGESRTVLKVRHPNAFHLRVSSEATPDTWLECASDGKELTRLYRTGELALVSKHPGGLKSLLEDAMTFSSLKGSGIDLLVRPDLHADVMASVSKVKKLANVKVDGHEAHHFSAVWFDGSEVEFWVAADREPLLLQWQRKQKVDLGDDQTHFVHTRCTLNWKTSEELPEQFSRISIPGEAIEVADLQHYLIEGGTDALLGKAAPEVPLEMLSGETWKLASHQGSHVVVLFFFASWAAPSTNDMPEILRFIEEYESKGVKFYAFNVGEDPAVVKDFVNKQNFTRPVVLDPQRQATSAYRITSLPVTVMIDQQGTLRSVHVGTSTEERASIRADLRRLVESDDATTQADQE